MTGQIIFPQGEQLDTAITQERSFCGIKPSSILLCFINWSMRIHSWVTMPIITLYFYHAVYCWQIKITRKVPYNPLTFKRNSKFFQYFSGDLCGLCQIINAKDIIQPFLQIFDFLSFMLGIIQEFLLNTFTLLFPKFLSFCVVSTNKLLRITFTSWTPGVTNQFSTTASARFFVPFFLLDTTRNFSRLLTLLWVLITNAICSACFRTRFWSATSGGRKSSFGAQGFFIRVHANIRTILWGVLSFRLPCKFFLAARFAKNKDLRSLNVPSHQNLIYANFLRFFISIVTTLRTVLPCFSFLVPSGLKNKTACFTSRIYENLLSFAIFRFIHAAYSFVVSGFGRFRQWAQSLPELSILSSSHNQINLGVA